MEEGIKKPPLNGGISQVIPITRLFNKCSASRQVCAADPPDVVDSISQNTVWRQLIHRKVENFGAPGCRHFFKRPAITGSFG